MSKCYKCGMPLDETDTTTYKDKSICEECLNELRVIDNINLVRYIANSINLNKKYIGFIDKDDLVSIGTMGLINAAKTFDESKEVKFSTYAGVCISREINRFFQLNNRHQYNYSIDMPFYYNEDETPQTILDRLESKDNIKINDPYFKQCIKKLKPIYKSIICHYYGAYGCRKMTCVEMAEKLHCRKQNISGLRKYAEAILGRKYKVDVK